MRRSVVVKKVRTEMHFIAGLINLWLLITVIESMLDRRYVKRDDQ